MSKSDKDARYILLIPYWDSDSHGDYTPNPKWEEDIFIITDKELDLNKLAKEHGIKKWAKYDADPADYDSWASKKKQDTAMLLQVRPFNIQPITVTTSWGFSKVPMEEYRNED